MCFLTYVDRPGVIGSFGRVLGDAGVNIAGMQVARDAKAEEVLVVLTLDSEIPAEVLAAISAEVRADLARTVDLRD